MPLYFFDLHDGDDHTVDDFGMDFDRFVEARNYAVSLLPDMAREELPDGPRRDFICDIRAESGEVVYQAVLRFREKLLGVALEPEAPAQRARPADRVASAGETSSI